ncbi:hypothetical protein CFC21_035127, partial [Triticum aestivum]
SNAASSNLVKLD